MKKSLILLPVAAVLLSLTGCKKDNEKSGPSGETVTLSATLGGGEKTEIYDDTKMKWSDGDAVTINKKEYTATFPFDDGTYTQASFVGVERAEDGKYKAYYPASLYDKDNDKYVLPSTQTYNAANYNILSGISPMYAVTENTELQFHNICALVKLEVTGEGTVKKIVVTSTDPLCGEFEPKTDDNVHYYAQIKGSGKEVTLKCGTGVALNATTPTTFYIALPQGELGNLTFKIGKSTSAAVNANLTAGKLYAKSMSDVVGSTPGALSGEFTVGMDGATPRKVNFSQGNLQYRASSKTWRFAENQWDYVGDATEGNVSEGNVKCNNAMISDSYTGWIDLFGWGTSGYDQTSTDATYVHYQPWSTDQTPSDYGPASGNLTGKSDWGYNAISNGGNRENAGWRTLTKSEWNYLLKTRQVNGGTGYGKTCNWVTINSVSGLIIFPDGYTGSSSVESIPDGCVFLPAAGYRDGTSVFAVGSNGSYWSSTPNDATFAYGLYFGSSGVNPAHSYFRYIGRSVRLVRPVEN